MARLRARLMLQLFDVQPGGPSVEDTDEAEEQLGSQRSGCSSRLHPLTPPLQAGGAKGNSELR